MRRSLGDSDHPQQDALGESWASSAKIGLPDPGHHGDAFVDTARGLGEDDRLGVFPTGALVSDVLDLGARGLLSQDSGLSLDAEIAMPSPASRARRTKSRSSSQSPASKPPSVVEKRFVCEMCGQAFNKPARLKRHTETHEKHRPSYVCTFEGCDRKYTREDHLKRHMVTHEGSKRFSCPVPGCGKSFYYRYHLRRHAAVHHDPDQDAEAGGSDDAKPSGDSGEDDEDEDDDDASDSQQHSHGGRQAILRRPRSAGISEAAAAEYESKMERQGDGRHYGEVLGGGMPMGAGAVGAMYSSMVPHMLGASSVPDGARRAVHRAEALRSPAFGGAHRYDAHSLGALPPSNKRHRPDLSFEDGLRLIQELEPEDEGVRPLEDMGASDSLSHGGLV